MDVNRRHLIGASAAGVAGALAMSPDAARAAPLTSALGRDATQYGVRPGSPDDQTRALQRAIDEAARAQVPLALPPGVYRTGMLRLQSGTQLVGVRGATRLVFNGGASMLQSEGAGSIGLTNITLDGGGIPLPTRRGLVHCLGGRDIRIIDCEITGSGGNGIWFENCLRRRQRQHHLEDRRDRDHLVRRAGPAGLAQHHRRHQRQRHRNPAHRDRRRRHPGARQPHRGHQGRARRLRTIRQRHQRVSRRQRHRARQPHPQLRLFRGARQFGLQHPDHRQQRQRRPRGGAVFRIRVRGRRDRQQHRRRRGAGRFGLQFQRGRPHRGRAGQHHPQPAAEAPDRHRAGRRRRHRHLCRGRYLGDRQRDRERAVVRDHRRLGQISARRRDHRAM